MSYETKPEMVYISLESHILAEQIKNIIKKAEKYLNEELLSEYDRTAEELQFKFYHNSPEDSTRHMSDCLSSFQRIAEGLFRNNQSIRLTFEDVLVHVCAILYHDIVHNFTNVEGQSNEELSAQKVDQPSIIAFLKHYGIHIEEGADKLTKFINRVHKIIIGTTAKFENKNIYHNEKEFTGVEISNEGITSIQQPLNTERVDGISKDNLDAVLTLAWDFGRVAMISNSTELLKYLNESLRCGIEVEVTNKILEAYEEAHNSNNEFDLATTLTSPGFEFYSAIQQFLLFCKDEKNVNSRKEKAQELLGAHKSPISTLMTGWFSSQFAFTQGVFDILGNKELLDGKNGLLSYIPDVNITQEQLFNVYAQLAQVDQDLQFEWFTSILSVNNQSLNSLSNLTQPKKELLSELVSIS